MIPTCAASSVARSVDGLSKTRSAFKRLVLLLCSDVHVLRGLTWRRVAYTFLVAVGFALWTAFGNWMWRRYGFNPHVGIADFFLYNGWGGLHVFRGYLLLFFSQMLALTVADNLHVTRVPRAALLVAGLVLGTTVGSAVIMTSGGYLDWPPVLGLTWGGLIAFVYFKRRRDEELAVALHAAQLARVELQKKALESQLQLMQARVEPQFLFNTLRKVRDLYETIPSSADRTLENLIVYLRSVLPQMRTSSSTLDQEVQLAQAYLNIERACRADRLDFAFDVPQDLAPIRFPPMVMVPLIEALTLRGHNGSDYDGAIRIQVQANGGKLQVIIMHTGGHAQPAIEECKDIVDRLSGLYGDDGKLDIEALGPRGTIARLSVPYIAPDPKALGDFSATVTK